MSVNRSNSQVRNLLAMFENNNNTTTNSNNTATDSVSPDRGRSNGHLSPASNADRPLSKVRSSFVSVEHGSPTPNPSQAMDIDPQKTKDEYQSRQESSANLRRESFSMDQSTDGDALANLRQSMTQEEERRGSNPMVAETIPEAAIEQTPAIATPAVEAKDYLAAGQVAHDNRDMPQSKLRHDVSADDVAADGDASQAADNDKPQAMTLPTDDLPADNPDKPVSGVQEEPGSMQASDLTDRNLVSPSPQEASAEPVPPVELPSRARRGTVTAADAVPAPVPHRPADLVPPAPQPSTEAAPKTPTSAKKMSTPTPIKKSPAAKPSSTLSPKPPIRKPSSSSLTQKPKPDTATAKTNSPQAKHTRPRSPTRPGKVSSHLTAPTAASAARQDSQPARASVSVSKPAVANRTQTRAPASAAAAKPAARSSLTSATNAPKKAETKPTTSTKGPDDGFLARMMRPTASSASKVHEKTELKSPPKRTPSVIRSKGLVKSRPAKAEKPKSSTPADKTEDAAGASTPQASHGAQEDEKAGLEATPAFDAATIR